MKYKTGEVVIHEDYGVGRIVAYQQYRDYYSVVFNNGLCSAIQEEEITLRTELTWDTATVGDVIVDRDGDEANILAVMGNVFLRSWFGGYDGVCDWYTFTDAKERGWTLKQETKQEMTVAEIEKELGRSIKVVK